MLPRLYAIVDTAFFADQPDPAAALIAYVRELISAGVTLLQYRNKSGTVREMLSQAREIKHVAAGRARLIMNDRADLCLAAGLDGVHVGQDDLSVESARSVVGKQLWVGVSTHNPDQVRESDQTSADYIAVGPVFATATKANPDPVIGLEGVRQARKLTRKPLVAIGGITRSNCRQVIDAGADSVAIISDLLAEPAKTAEEFLRTLGDLR
jgi:thiamine-phosphate pyrophosphorylase